MIPFPPKPLIHLYWDQGACELPADYKTNALEWRDFCWSVQLWDRASALAAWPDLEPLFSRAAHAATRADLTLARAALQFGGLIAGTDCRLLQPQPLRHACQSLESFVTCDGPHGLASGFSWFRSPGSVFLQNITAAQLVAQVGNKNVAEATGPRLWGRVHADTAPEFQPLAISCRQVFSRHWQDGWRNPRGWVDPGFAASWRH